MLEAFLAAWIGVALAQASPGPNMMAVAAVALGQGRKAALLVVAGIGTGSLLWAAAVAFGLGALFSAFPLLLTLLKFVGGLYLLFIGVKAVRSVFSSEAAAVAATTAPLGDLAAWRRGLFVVMTNPKAVLMWSALATFLFGAGLNGWQVLAFGPLAALSALLIYGAYGLLFSTGVAMRAYARFWQVVEAAFGLAFGALGTTLLIWGLRDLRG
jgi:threonine efflux protein